MQPGMYGTMELILQKFENAYLLPASAIIGSGGKTFIVQVIDGVARRVPVRVQLEDGVQVKVAVVVRDANPEAGEEDVLEDLTGEEEIIRSGQGEIAPGQKVKATPVDW